MHTHLCQILQVRVKVGSFFGRETRNEVGALTEDIEKVQHGQNNIQIRTR